LAVGVKVLRDQLLASGQTIAATHHWLPKSNSNLAIPRAPEIDHLQAALESAAGAAKRVKRARQKCRGCSRSHAILAWALWSPQKARALHLPRRSPWRRPGCRVVGARTHQAHRHQLHRIRARLATEAPPP